MTWELPHLLESNLAGVIAVAAIVTAAFVVSILGRTPSIRRSMGGVLVAVTVYGAIQALRSGLDLAGADPFLRFFGLLALAYAGLRVVMTLGVDLVLDRRGHKPVPQILRQVTFGGLLLIVVLILLREGFDVDLGSLLATSAVLSLVLGLALQDTLGNVFAGLSIQAEKPFVVGEWVTVGEHTGRIVQIGWRTTEIETLAIERVSLPNNVLAREVVQNHNRPVTEVAHTLELRLPYDAPPNEVKTLIRDVLAGEPGVVIDPPPVIRFSGFADHYLHFRVRFWIADMLDTWRINDALYSAVWYRLQRAGVELPLPTRNVFVHQEDQASRERARAERRKRIWHYLRDSELLAPLSDADLSILVERGRELTYGAGEVVFQAGSGGQSCYLVLQGHLTIEGLDGLPQGELAAGQLFGEGALLTGELRQATVRAAVDARTLQISREAFREVLLANETIAKELAHILEDRRQALATREVGGRDEELAANPRSHGASRLLVRIREIFGLD